MSINVNVGETWHGKEFWIVCGDNCQCEEDECRCDPGCGILFSPGAETPEEVVELWNKRTGDSK